MEVAGNCTGTFLAYVEEFIGVRLLAWGGQVESLKIVTHRNTGDVTGYINFVYPDEAQRFAQWGEENVNYKKTYVQSDGTQGTVFFNLQKKPRTINYDIAEGIINHGYSRVLIAQGIPNNIELHEIKNNIPENKEFWLAEILTGGGGGASEWERDITIEFIDIKDALRCYKYLTAEYDAEALHGKGVWGRGLVWGPDSCERDARFRK